MSAREEYEVRYRVIDYCSARVWAETAQEAARLVLDGKGERSGIDYMETEVVDVDPVAALTRERGEA